jgi:hypothetical protein
MTFIESLLYWLLLMSQPNVDAGPGVRGPDRADRDAKEQTQQDVREDEDDACGTTMFCTDKDTTYKPRWGRISNGL